MIPNSTTNDKKIATNMRFPLSIYAKLEVYSTLLSATYLLLSHSLNINISRYLYNSVLLWNESNVFQLFGEHNHLFLDTFSEERAYYIR